MDQNTTEHPFSECFLISYEFLFIVFYQQDVLKIFTHLVDGLSVLHENNIVHGDFKHQNVLVNGYLFIYLFISIFFFRKNEVKIADFGSSKKMTGTLQTNKTSSTGSTVNGTLFLSFFLCFPEGLFLLM
jgi:serine/threonine protein kinase